MVSSRSKILSHYPSPIHHPNFAHSTTSPLLSDYDGRTALHIAAAEGNKEVALLLMRWNANVNAKDNYNNSPLSDALKGEQFEMAKLIHSKGGG